MTNIHKCKNRFGSLLLTLTLGLFALSVSFYSPLAAAHPSTVPLATTKLNFSPKITSLIATNEFGGFYAAWTAPTGNWRWPSGRAVKVLRRFEPPAYKWSPGHRGVDLQLPPGTIIRAAAEGTVAFVGTVVDRPVISIDHGTIRTTYEPVEASVTKGQKVSSGQPIGTLIAGHDNNALHWGARIGKDTYIDPLRLLVGKIRLLPL